MTSAIPLHYWTTLLFCTVLLQSYFDCTYANHHPPRLRKQAAQVQVTEHDLPPVSTSDKASTTTTTTLQLQQHEIRSLLEQTACVDYVNLTQFETYSGAIYIAPQNEYSNDMEMSMSTRVEGTAATAAASNSEDDSLFSTKNKDKDKGNVHDIVYIHSNDMPDEEVSNTNKRSKNEKADKKDSDKATNRRSKERVLVVMTSNGPRRLCDKPNNGQGSLVPSSQSQSSTNREWSPTNYMSNDSRIVSPSSSSSSPSPTGIPSSIPSKELVVTPQPTSSLPTHTPTFIPSQDFSTPQPTMSSSSPTSSPSSTPSSAVVVTEQPTTPPILSAMPTIIPTDSTSSMSSIGRDGGNSTLISNPYDDKCNMTLNERLQSIYDQIILLSNENLLNKNNSAQSKAFDWLVYNDTRHICPTEDDSSLRQRYILAVLYHAMNGKEWVQCNNVHAVSDLCWIFGGKAIYHWLSSKNECEWYGITCDDEGLVLKIRLGTCGTQKSNEEQAPVASVIVR